MAKLLPAIAGANPAAIVVDWSNAPGSCRDRAKNADFTDAVKCANGVTPVLFGRSTWSQESLHKARRKDEEALPEDTLRKDRFILQDDLLDNSGIGFGLIRLNCDVRRIPLGWYVSRASGRQRRAKRLACRTTHYPCWR